MRPARYALALLAAAAVLLTGCGVTASSRNPGFANFDGAGYGGLQRDTSISLGPTVLGLAARHVDDNPQAKALLQALDGVRIKVYRLDTNTDRASLARQLDASAAALDADWQRIVRVREPDSTVHILLRQSGDAILGLAILAVDEEELVFVNVMGELTPAMLRDLSPAVPEEQALALRYLPLHQARVQAGN